MHNRALRCAADVWLSSGHSVSSHISQYIFNLVTGEQGALTQPVHSSLSGQVVPFWGYT